MIDTKTSSKQILITGANGFLGSHLVRLFSKNYFKVIALVRKNSDIKFIKFYKNVEIVFIDFEDQSIVDSQLINIFSKVDYIIHCAAVAKDWGEYSDFYKTNVELTNKIFKIASTCVNIKKFIHISTNAVLGEEDCHLAKDESAPYNAKLNYFLENVFPSAMNFYRTTKQIGEQSLIEQYTNSNALKNLDLIVLRPVWIYGPREFHAGPYEYCKTVLSKIPCMPGRKSNFFHAIYVEDLAQVILKIISSNLKGLSIYNIGASNIITMENFYKYFCYNLKIKKPYNLPYFFLLPFVLLLEVLFLLFKISTAPTLTRARLYMLFANNIYNISKIEQELNISLKTDWERTIRKTVKWWRINKYL